MITVLLLLPVSAVLAWVYRLALPGGQGWSRFDTVLLLALAVLAGAWCAWCLAGDHAGAGPVYGDVLAAAGAYPIIAAGLGLGLAWRRAGIARGRRR